MNKRVEAVPPHPLVEVETGPVLAGLAVVAGRAPVLGGEHRRPGVVL